MRSRSVPRGRAISGFWRSLTIKFYRSGMVRPHRVGPLRSKEQLMCVPVFPKRHRNERIVPTQQACLERCEGSGCGVAQPARLRRAHLQRAARPAEAFAMCFPRSSASSLHRASTFQCRCGEESNRTLARPCSVPGRTRKGKVALTTLTGIEKPARQLWRCFHPPLPSPPKSLPGHKDGRHRRSTHD